MLRLDPLISAHRAAASRARTLARAVRRVTSAAIALGALATSERVGLANPTSRLVYVRGAGAESCPDEPEVRRAVATRLGYDPFRPIASTTLTAEIKRDSGVFRGRVRLVDHAGIERGARDLESRAADCRDLTTAMALSMSIAIDPLSMMRAPKAELAATPAAQPEPEGDLAPAAPAPAPAPPDAPAKPAARPDGAAASTPRVALSAGAHVAFGIAPAPALGLHVAAELATTRWSMQLEGRFDLAASAESSEGGRSRTSLAGAAAAPCLRVPLVWVCGVVLVARVEAEAIEVSAPRSDAFAFFGAGGRVFSSIALPEDFRLRIGGDVLAHPAPFELTVNGRSVHRSSSFSGLGGISLAKIF